MDLSNKWLTSVPSWVSDLVNLTSLLLTWWWRTTPNNLTTLPSDIVNLLNLQLLDLSWNTWLWSLSATFLSFSPLDITQTNITPGWDGIRILVSAFPASITLSVITTEPGSCASTPGFANIWTTTIWTPTSAGQSWTYNETPWNCTYICTWWYIWTNCVNSCDNATKPVDNTHIIYTENPTSYNQIYVKGSTECWYTCEVWYTWTDCATVVTCWETLSVWWYTYTTTLWADGNCWTNQNMNHWTMLADIYTTPSDPNTIEKWCYNNDSNLCDTEWWLYTWSEAMWLNDICNTTNCGLAEDTTKSVCGKLWTWWWLPTLTQTVDLRNAWATWWTWNQLSWIVSSLPGRVKVGGGVGTTFFGRSSYITLWTSYDQTTTEAKSYYLWSSNSTVYHSNFEKFTGATVVCIKNY